MSSAVENNKRIAKNSIILYVRFLFTMAVNLYTSRVVLSVLGVDDFGLYAVVTSAITIFFFLNASMVGATSRFLTFELGKKDLVQLKKTFSASLTTHIVIALVIVILGETIGLWYLENRMVVPENRMTAVRWVYQLAIISSTATIIQSPYNASILAHERMNVYAYIEIFNTCLKLGIVYLLTIGNLDKIILYAILTLGVSIVILTTYIIYCLLHFEECKYKFEWDKKIIYPMLSFSGWNLLTNGAYSLSTQGIQIILNIFFANAINAAYGIAMQIHSAFYSLAMSFLMAVKPQIVKYYAEDRVLEMENLTINATKFSFLFLFSFSFPVMLEMDFVLDLWLKQPPEFATIFCRLFLIIVLLTVLSENIFRCIQATGKMKTQSIYVGGLLTLIPVIAYLFFKLGNTTPYMPLLIALGVYIMTFFARLIIAHRLIPQVSVSRFLKKVVLTSFIIVFISSILPLFAHYSIDGGFFRFVLVVLSSISSVAIATYYIGLSRQMREKVIYTIRQKILTIKR